MTNIKTWCTLTFSKLQRLLQRLVGLDGFREEIAAMNAHELAYIRDTFSALNGERKRQDAKSARLEREIEDAASRTTLALYDAAEQVAMLRAFLQSVADSDAFDEFVKQKEAESEQARATGHTDTGDIGG